MEFLLNKDSFIIFDLDDTLYSEVCFLKSAFNEIAGSITKEHPEKLSDAMFYDYKQGNDVFSKLISAYPDLNLKKNDLISVYRNHIPSISLKKNADQFINFLIKNNIPIGLITDGRSITQRNKISSLGISDIFHQIVISEEFGSEKPHINNFLQFEKNNVDKSFTYIADNTGKDFITPGLLGWQLVCVLNDGSNIHSQDLSILPDNTILINDFKELIIKY